MKPEQVRRAFAPPKWTDARGHPIPAITSIKAMAAGTASAQQQIEGMNFIIEELAGLYDEPFRPDEVGAERETAYALGRAYVGRVLRQIIVQPVNRLTGKKETA